QLRYLLVQEWDLDADGHHETLRLLYATPRAWLADGKEISVQHAPTAFGEVSFTVKSDLQHNKVTAQVQLPQRKTAQTSIRFRVPRGWSVTGATAGDVALKSTAAETFDITALS